MRHLIHVRLLGCDAAQHEQEGTKQQQILEKQGTMGLTDFTLCPGSTRLWWAGEHKMQLQTDAGQPAHAGGTPGAQTALSNRFTVRFPGPSMCLQPQPGQARPAPWVDNQEGSPFVSVQSRTGCPFPTCKLPSGTT